MVRILVLLLAAMLAWPSPAFAQQARPDLTRFKAFADAMVGEWDVVIRDLDESGSPTWEGRQKRVIAYILADEFLEERAMVHSRRLNREIVAGLHLSSYDPATNAFIQQGFWPGQPGVLFNVNAVLSSDHRRAEGTIAMPRETGIRAMRRIEIVWASNDEFSYRTFARGADGREYLNEELVYRRAARS